MSDMTKIWIVTGCLAGFAAGWLAAPKPAISKCSWTVRLVREYRTLQECVDAVGVNGDGLCILDRDVADGGPTRAEISNLVPRNGVGIYDMRREPYELWMVQPHTVQIRNKP